MMKRFLATCAFLVVSYLPLSAARPAFMQSLVSVQMAVPTRLDDPTPTICTGSRVAPNLYLTAHHCVEEKDKIYFINHHTAEVVSAAPAHDLALVRAFGHKGPALALADAPLSWGDTVHTAGRPFGGPVHFFSGKVANPSFWYDNQEYVIFDLRVAGGQSGSPIVNKHGKLVSVMQIGVKGLEPFANVSGGATWRDLRRFLQGWV